MKLPINILPSISNYTTPWHSSCALELDGSLRYAHRGLWGKDPEYELVHLHGRPSYFRRKSDLFHWRNLEIDVEPIYPCGLVIKPKHTASAASMTDIDMGKVRRLAELNSPIVLRGFANTKDLSLFKKKAHEMGTVMPWKFGDVLVVRDAGSESGGLNNVLSAEPMPMHFDGLFKTAKILGENGVERLVPQPPRHVLTHMSCLEGFANVRFRFQFFTVVTPPAKDGLTLLASSRNVFSHLPKPYTLEQLSTLTWSCRTSAFDATKLAGLKLVEPHPSLSTPCLRYHEPWSSDRTKFDATEVHIENGSDDVLGILDNLLYDRRVCYYHAWEDGDLVVSDNINMLHTRSGFIPGAPRELWRIHVN